MTQIEIAHIREQGVDMIIVPLDQQFGWKSASDQNAVISELQLRARSAGLAGTVVPVWDHGGGRMAFIAPVRWQSFFRSITLRFVWANVNKQLSW